MIDTLNVKEIGEKLSSIEKGETSSGQNCVFISVSETIGLKTYRSPIAAYISFHGQLWGNDRNIAPKIYGEIFEVGGRWCFLTEKVTPIIDIIGMGENGVDIIDDEGLSLISRWEEEHEEDYEDILTWLGGVIKEYKFDYHDCHVGNFGINSRGKLQIIDWDRCNSVLKINKEKCYELIHEEINCGDLDYYDIALFMMQNMCVEYPLMRYAKQYLNVVIACCINDDRREKLILQGKKVG